MTADAKPSAARLLRLGVWALFVAAFAFLYYRYSSLWGTELTTLAASSVWLAYGLYVFLGALRGFASAVIEAVRRGPSAAIRQDFAARP